MFFHPTTESLLIPNAMKIDKARILLIEDSEPDQIIVQRAFEEGEVACDIHTCSSGEEAIKYLKHLQQTQSLPSYPDLILMDVNMPVLDGKQTIKAIRSEPAFNYLPIIILTTSSMSADVCECYQLGANAYLTKSVDHDEFIESIRSMKRFWFELARLPTRSTRNH